MASILQVQGKWRAQIRRAGMKSITQTFRTKSQAQVWAREIEAKLDAGGAPATLDKRTVSALIADYRLQRSKSRPIGAKSNEHYMLDHLTWHGMGAKRVEALTPDYLSGWCRDRIEDGAGPYTLNMEISQLGTVLKFAGMSGHQQLPDVVGNARPLLAMLGLIGDGGKRDRRPTADELERIIGYKSQPWFPVVVRFAVATAMRRGEIVALKWADLEEERRCIWVRNRKDPRRKVGNDQLVPLLAEAWEIVKVMPRDGDYLFPLNAQTISKEFKRVCDALSIPDLHFHDLRHEATSRLFERGFTIEQVAMVTGHQSWVHLKRYTQLKPEQIHDIDRSAPQRP